MSSTEIHAEVTGANGSGNGQGALVAVPNFGQLPAVPWGFDLPHRPEILSAKPSPVDLWHALRRRWLLAVGLGSLTGVICLTAVWYFFPIRYEAVAMVKVAAKTESILDEGDMQAQHYNTYKRTQMEMIRSDMVLNAALREKDRTKEQYDIRRLALVRREKDPIGWLRSELNVDSPGDAELIRVMMSGDKANEVYRVVNAVVDAYMTEVVAADVQRHSEEMERLKKELVATSDKLKEMRSQSNKLEKDSSASSGETYQMKKKLLLGQYETMTRQQQDLLRQASDVAVKLYVLQDPEKDADETPIPDAVVDAEISKNPLVAELERNIYALRQYVSAQESLARRKDNPGVMRLRNQLATQEESLEQLKAELKTKTIEQFRNVGDLNALNLPALKSQYKVLAAQFKKVQEDTATLSDQLTKLEHKSADLDQLLANIKQTEDLQRQLSNKYDLARIRAGSVDRRIKVLQEAVPPTGDDALRKYIGIAFSGMAGFGLMLFAIAYIEFQGRRLNTSRDVNEGLGVRVMGDMPGLHGRTARRLQTDLGDAGLQALLAESIDSIRTALIHSTVVDSPRVVVVTSAEEGEGKTTVATQLAASLARSGRRTLLIDADLRHPTCHLVFDVSLEPGLCDILRRSSERSAAIQPTPSANLAILAAGRCDMRSVQALAGEALANLIAALRVEYEFIVIDSGPVLHVADPLLLGQHADAAILAVQRDVSRLPGVYEACERLKAVGVTILGAVVNGGAEHARRYNIEMHLSEAGETA